MENTDTELNLVYQAAPESQENENKKSYTDYENSTYMVISKVAYLIGVPLRIFENEHEPPKLEWYEKLQKDKSARIIRNLCMLRTALERGYSQIFKLMRYEMKNLHTLPDLIPQDALRQLSDDGIEIERANYKPTQYIIDINKYISDRINNCKGLFPIWLKWEYIRSLFIMPDGLSENGIKAAANEYYADRNKFPYQVYMNWGYLSAGNILYNDKKFVTLLYEANRDYFSDLSKVSDAGNITKNEIYKFLENSEKVDMVVDCENSDPFKLYATLNNLDQKALLGKINKIILFDDEHTTNAWPFLNDFTTFSVEHILIERVKDQKSLVDMRLALGTSREFFINHIDSFILVSSDSDYWGLIDAMPEARFFVMVEDAKCSSAIMQKLIDAGISFCFIDDFCTGNSEEIKIAAVLAEVRRTLESSFSININDVLQNAYTATRAELTTAEKKQIYDRYIKPMKIVFSADGDLSLQLGS